MTAADIERVAALCGQLGYPSAPAEVADRFEVLRARSGHALLVAEEDRDSAPSGSENGRAVVGWVHVHETLTLEAGPFAELGGLVVDEKAYGRGAGRMLVDAAEEWAAARGYPEMRVRSNVIRAGAHQFYKHLGYDVIKTQLNFRKTLGRRGGQ